MTAAEVVGEWVAPSRLLTLLLQVPGCQQSVKITFGFYPGLVELGYHSKQQHTGHRAGFLSEQQYIEYNWSQIWGEICKHQTALPASFVLLNITWKSCHEVQRNRYLSWINSVWDQICAGIFCIEKQGTCLQSIIIHMYFHLLLTML